MTSSYQLIWSLADYQRFLRHADPIARDWASRRIERQYPVQAAESIAVLLTDPDPYLQMRAAHAIADSGDPRHEPALVAAYPQSEGFVRNWFATTLGKLNSPALLPQLVAELQAAPDQCPPEEEEMLALRSRVEALGYYPDQRARGALWDFVERYRDDDRITYAAFSGLLDFPEPDAISRLVRRYGQLRPRSEALWQHAIEAFAAVIGVHRMTQEIARAMPDGPDEALWQLDEWLQEDVIFSETFEDAFYAAAAGSYAGVLPLALVEVERMAAEQGDDVPAWLEAWRGGQRPVGYRWRMLYTHQVIAALAEHPPSDAQQYQAAVALGLALLGQALIDEDDEAMLDAAPDESARHATLLNILGSPRQTVMPDMVEQVAALGPEVVPSLIHILEGDDFWAQPRTLKALTCIAREYPGTADVAVPAILDLIDEDQSDYVLEPAEDALIAIGPSAIASAAARLGQDDTYDIFVGSALSEIPTQASAEALMNYIASKELLEEYEAEHLAALGHPAAIPFLQDYYSRGDSLLATTLYTLSLVNQYSGLEMIEWWAVALKSYANFIRISTGKQPTWVPIPDLDRAARAGKEATGEKTHEKRLRAKAGAQRNRQGKHKKRRR